MKRILLLGICLTVLYSCRKKNKAPDVAEIVYTDIKDTTVFRRQGMSFDFDKDGHIDIGFAGEKLYYIYDTLRQRLTEVNPVGNVSISYGPKVSGRSYNLTQGSLVFSGLDWTNKPMALSVKSYPTTYSGYWDNASHEGYIGLRYSMASSVRYGWARISLSDSGAVTLYEYAINKTFDQPIYAGQKE